MPFLLNFTNPSTDSISARYQRCSSFVDGDQQSSAELVSVSANNVSVCFQDVPTAPTWSEDETTGWFGQQFMLGDDDELWWEDILGSSASSQSEGVDSTRLEARMEQVLMALNVLNCSTGLHQVLPAFDKLASASLFSGKNLVEFSNVYFDHWSSHCPILHRPTFDLTKIHLPLLLAVFLIGESYSTESYCSRGQPYYDLAEEYAFSHPCFRNLSVQDQPTADCASSDLETLQAAYLMVLLQMSGNNIPARRRVRDQRYHKIIVAARRLRLFDSRNEYLHCEWVNTTGFDWQKFALRESRIRLAYLIFGIECNFSMFHSTYPRIPISEMTGDPMCSENCFSATTSAECERYARRELRSKSLSISACVNALLQSAAPISITTGLEDIFPVSFFFVLCGLHCVINAARANNIGSSMGSVFMKALDQWIATWKIQLANVSVEESSKLGFMKDAGIEFWQLATIFVRAEALGMFDSDELRNMSAESMEGVSCLLEVFYLADTNTSRRCSSGKVLESLDER